MTSPEKSKIVVKMVQDKVTPGTVRFKEVPDNAGDPDVLVTVYVKKWAAQVLGNPGSLVITVEAGD